MGRGQPGPTVASDVPTCHSGRCASDRGGPRVPPRKGRDGTPLATGDKAGPRRQHRRGVSARRFCVVCRSQPSGSSRVVLSKSLRRSELADIARSEVGEIADLLELKPKAAKHSRLDRDGGGKGRATSSTPWLPRRTSRKQRRGSRARSRRYGSGIDLPRQPGAYGCLPRPRDGLSWRPTTGEGVRVPHGQSQDGPAASQEEQAPRRADGVAVAVLSGDAGRSRCDYSHPQPSPQRILL